MDDLGKSDDCVEDDTLRSRYIQRLVYSHISTPTIPPDNLSIPREIVQYWNDLTAVPNDVQECLDSWAALETQGYTRVLFDDHEARAFISSSFDRRYVSAYDLCHHPAMRCDYFRLCYLLEKGGFYVDADDVYQNGDCGSLFHDGSLKLQPLCYDMATDSMVSARLFQTPTNASPHWIFYVNNNPLVAPAHHPLVRLALSRATNAILTGTRPLDIQSTTGPGNLSASLVMHFQQLIRAGAPPDVTIVLNWENISLSRWPLSYRADQRNWRRWKSPDR